MIRKLGMCLTDGKLHDILLDVSLFKPSVLHGFAHRAANSAHSTVLTGFSVHSILVQLSFQYIFQDTGSKLWSSVNLGRRCGKEHHVNMECLHG